MLTYLNTSTNKCIINSRLVNSRPLTLQRINISGIQIWPVLRKSQFFHKVENLNSWCYENNYSRQLFSRKRSIVDGWQDCEYARVLNIPGFRIQQGSKYASVLVKSGFWIYHNSEYASGTEYTKALNIPGLQSVLNMPVNMSVCLYLNTSEYARICINISASSRTVFAF